MPDLVNQPDWKPTRKQFWGSISGLATMGTLAYAETFAMSHPDFAWLSTGDAKGLLAIIVAGGIGYLIKDKANVPSSTT